MRRIQKIGLLIAFIILLGSGTFGALLASGWPNYGTCANGTFKIAKVYKPNNDQVISENSKNYMLYPFNKMGDVIPKENVLFIVFATYGEKKPSLMSIEFKIRSTIQDGKIAKGYYEDGQGVGIGYYLGQNLSILYPFHYSIQKGDRINMRIIVNQPAGTGFDCTWQGTVE